MLAIGVLCSGGLGFEILKNIQDEYNVKFVLTNKTSVEIIQYCIQNSISYFSGNPRKGKGYAFIKNHKIDVLASINYLFLIEEDIIKHPTKLAFNVHGSLLPKYRGRTPHVWAIINNEKTTGITAHKIELGCDTGDILKQMEIIIEEDDTGANILQKFTANYKPLVFDVLKFIEDDNITAIPQDDSKATYFGKRTPDDGEINWNWDKERIKNWVRAQAHPYPGAFTFYDNNKLIIDKVSFSDLGFNFNQQNGTILNINPLVVKVCNGTLELVCIRQKNINFVKDKILG